MNTKAKTANVAEENDTVIDVDPKTGEAKSGFKQKIGGAVKFTGKNFLAGAFIGLGVAASLAAVAAVGTAVGGHEA